MRDKITIDGMEYDVEPLEQSEDEDSHDEERELDDDVAVWQNIMQEVYAYHGHWKRWIPFYTVHDVHEVEVLMARDVKHL